MLACFRPSASVSKRHKGEIGLPEGEKERASHPASIDPQGNYIASHQEIEPIGMHAASADSTSDSTTQALCFHILSHSPNLISIFKDNSNGQEVVYQNVKSLEYYGDLKAAYSKDSSLFTHILKSLLSFEKSADVALNSVLFEFEATGSWAGSIKVPQQLFIGQDTPAVSINHQVAVIPSGATTLKKTGSPRESGLNPNVAGLLSTHQDQETSRRPLALPHSMSDVLVADRTDLLDLPDPISAPITLDQVSAFSASFRKAPLRVKSLLMPSLQTMYMKSIGSTATASRNSADKNNMSNHDHLTRIDTGCSKALSSRGVISRTATDSKDIASSPLFVRKSEDAVRTALESEMPQLVSPPANAGFRPPRLPSMASDLAMNLNVWEEEVDDEGLALAYASANKSNNPGKPFQWHDIDVKKIQHPTTGEPLIIVTQNEVTIRVAMEKAMLTCADTQLNMVSSIFPAHVVEYFNQREATNFVNERQQDIGHLARPHKDVTILFMDIVGFTSMSKEVEPSVVMKFLNDLFGSFDNSVDKYKVQKVETAGDCYIVAAGVLTTGPDGFSEVLPSHNPQLSATRVLSFAQLMLHQSRTMTMPHNGEPVVIRIGIHTGDCVSGLVGSKLHKFGLFGDTMNTASRMESTCQPGRIQISSSTYGLLSEHQQTFFEATGGVEVKGKGQMETFLWLDTSCTLSLSEAPSPAAGFDDMNIILGTRSIESGLQQQIASAASNSLSADHLPSIQEDIMCSMNSVGSVQKVSPFEAMTRACQDAVNLLNTIADSTGKRSSSLIHKIKVKANRQVPQHALPRAATTIQTP